MLVIPGRIDHERGELALDGLQACDTSFVAPKEHVTVGAIDITGPVHLLDKVTEVPGIGLGSVRYCPDLIQGAAGNAEQTPDYIAGFALGGWWKFSTGVRATFLGLSSFCRRREERLDPAARFIHLTRGQVLVELIF